MPKPPVVVTREVAIEIPEASKALRANLAARLKELVTERQRVHAAFKTAEARVKELSLDIQVVLDKAKLQPGAALIVDHWKVALVKSTYARLDKMKLLEAGVTPKTLERCTVSTESIFVRVDDLQKPAKD